MVWVYFLVYLGLVFLSAFFSSAETALISLDQGRLKHKASLKDRSAERLLALLAKPETLLSTLLIGNNLVNVAVASLTTVLSSRFISGDSQWVVLVSTGITTVVLLTFGEIIPKSLGFRHRDTIAEYYAKPVRLFQFLIYPVVSVFSYLSRLFMGKAAKGGGKRLSLRELKHLLASEVEMFSNEPETLKMVNEIIDLAERDVKSVMTARVDVVSVPLSEGLAGLSRMVAEKRFHTIPVFSDSGEQVVGIVSAKNLVTPLLSGKLDNLTLQDVMDPPLFVSEFSSLRYVLGQFRRYRTHIAVVIDEYGDALGIVTQSDIFQNVLGNLDAVSSPVQRVSGRVYRVLGNLAVDEARTLLPVEIEEKKDYATVAGFFIYQYGKMPREGARLRHKGVVWMVEKLDGLRIERLKVILEHSKKKRGGGGEG
jgi:putative hemolysin